MGEEEMPVPFPPPAPEWVAEDFGSGSGNGGGSGYDFAFETASEEDEFTVTPIDDTTAIVNVTGNQTMTVNTTTPASVAPTDDSGPVGAPEAAPMDVVGADPAVAGPTTAAPMDDAGAANAIAPTEAVPVGE